MWFPIALAGYFFLALTFILDKIILSKSLDKPVVYTFYSTIFMFAALFAWPLGVELLHGIDWVWALVSGIAFGFALWTLYKAVKSGEASHINPFNGAIVTISTYALSGYLLSEQLSNLQIIGIIVLASASLLLSFEHSKKHRGFHMGFVWAIISGLLFAVSHVSAKYLYDLYPFLTGFVWTRATTGLVGLLVLIFPSVRKALRKKKNETEIPKTIAKKYVGLIVVATKILGVIAVVLIQYAISIGSVSLVTALSGLQYVCMFLLILFFTKFSPKVFNEYFTQKERALEWVAIFLVCAGSVMFVL
ncbi:MAG: EamA family transporter [Candidatus Magasanikbacteria bacterium]|nr:EamA family transporter [Candidatus Magasanikbacteria bacterium]